MLRFISETLFLAKHHGVEDRTLLVRVHRHHLPAVAYRGPAGAEAGRGGGAVQKWDSVFDRSPLLFGVVRSDLVQLMRSPCPGCTCALIAVRLMNPQGCQKVHAFKN